MKSKYKNLDSVVAILNAMAEHGALEPGQKEDLVTAVKRLKHALETSNMKAIDKSIADMARVLLRSDIGN